MTNWCHNRMKITGPISEITRFKQTCIRTVTKTSKRSLISTQSTRCRIFLAITTHCRTPGPMLDWSDRALGHQRERSRFPRDGRCAWLLRISFLYLLQSAGPCLGEDGKNVPRSRIFPERR